MWKVRDDARQSQLPSPVHLLSCICDIETVRVQYLGLRMRPLNHEKGSVEPFIDWLYIIATAGLIIITSFVAAAAHPSLTEKDLNFKVKFSPVEHAGDRNNYPHTPESLSTLSAETARRLFSSRISFCGAVYLY